MFDGFATSVVDVGETTIFHSPQRKRHAVAAACMAFLKPI